MINKDRNYFFLLKSDLKHWKADQQSYQYSESLTQWHCIWSHASINGRYNRYHQRKILFVYVPQDMSLAFIVKNFSFISEGRKHLTFNRLYLDFMMSELRNISIFFHASFCCPWSLIFFRDIFELTDMKIVYFQSVFSLKYDSLIWSWCFSSWSGHDFYEFDIILQVLHVRFYF